MTQLRYLRDVELYEFVRTKQPNGSYLRVPVFVEKYRAELQELDDVVSVTVYGADIRSVLRIQSVRSRLERFLATKVTAEPDNISNYNIALEGRKYRILSVRETWIDMQLIGKLETVHSL